MKRGKKVFFDKMILIKIVLKKDTSSLMLHRRGTNVPSATVKVAPAPSTHFTPGQPLSRCADESLPIAFDTSDCLSGETSAAQLLQRAGAGFAREADSKWSAMSGVDECRQGVKVVE
jgi:hypothetical protein